MKKLILALLLPVVVSVAPMAVADDPAPEKCEGKDCLVSVCFNLVCSYRAHDPRGREYKECQAAARFNKNVTRDGREVDDDSVHPDNPDFEVSCDDRVIFNNAAYRFTDYQGTRIQAVQGPYPAVLLPRGALRDTHGYVTSALELSGQSLKGYCYLYTGPSMLSK